MRDRIEKLAAESPVLLAFMVFLVTAAIVVPTSVPFYFSNPEGFLTNVMAEGYGTLFDLLIIGWLLVWLNNLADRRQRKNRYHEEIEDALGWRSPVASHRIVSNIRRLNRSGVTGGLELPEAYLKGTSLDHAGLAESNLWGANLEQASLRQADLSGSIGAGANFEEADLESARFEAADLRGTNLRAADMERAHLEDADLRGANLTDADLQYARLRGICLERADLSGTNLRAAAMTGADLNRANLNRANLTGAQIDGARFDGADLTDAHLRETDLRGARFDGAILRGADLAGAQLFEDDVSIFESVETLYDATLDDGLRRNLKDAYPHLFEPPEEGASGRQEKTAAEDETPFMKTASNGRSHAPAPKPPAPKPKEKAPEEKAPEEKAPEEKAPEEKAPEEQIVR